VGLPEHVNRRTKRSSREMLVLSPLGNGCKNVHVSIYAEHLSFSCKEFSKLGMCKQGNVMALGYVLET
jgi:hypothetical protein